MAVHLLPDEHGDSMVHECCYFTFGGTYASHFVSRCRDGVRKLVQLQIYGVARCVLAREWSEVHIFVPYGGVNGGDLMVRDSRCFVGPWSASVRSMLLLRNNGNENGSRAKVATVIGAGVAGEIDG